MEAIWALGAMSGTSLDGVDVAELLTDGETIAGFGATAYRRYAGPERDALRAALGRWPGEAGVAAAARVVEAAHVEVLGSFLDASLIGFHGQTLAHDPAAGRTHQAGDGASLAAALGRPVVWDFRSSDVARGGEGAPLAPVFHHACARHAGADRPLAMLNLGGVGNLTWIDPSRADPAAALLAFDTGPANAPIDDLCARLGQAYDAEGALARAGRARRDLVAEILHHPFFERAPPKSLDRDAFRAAGAAIDALAPPDAAATWVAVLARHGRGRPRAVSRRPRAGARHRRWAAQPGDHGRVARCGPDAGRSGRGDRPRRRHDRGASLRLSRGARAARSADDVPAHDGRRRTGRRGGS